MNRELTLDVIRAQLAMAKNALATASICIATVERILAHQVPDTPDPKDEPADEEESNEGTENSALVTPETCDHPRQCRMSAKVMGKPNRWLCTRCGGNFDE
jgi:hypothetical protein